MQTPAEAGHHLCQICGSPLDHSSKCSTPNCGQSSIPYEVWLRSIIDYLWAEGWELSKIQPPPPLKIWYTAKCDAHTCALNIMKHNKRTTKRPYKKRKRKTK